MEIWKDIEGFEGLYEVSNKGRVRSLNRCVNGINPYTNTPFIRIVKGRIRKPGCLGKTPHQTITLCKDGKLYSMPLHRIVAIAFVPNPNNYPCVNHIDENPSNNDATNLEWCTYQYNNNYGNALIKRSKTRTKNIQCIETGEIYTAKEIADKFNCKQDSVYNHLRGNAKSLKSLHFRYID